MRTDQIKPACEHLPLFINPITARRRTPLCAVEESRLDVSQARVSILQTSGSGVPLLFLHGNSCCKEVFRRQLEDPIARRHRCIALDLPGHGDSSDARDASSYTFSGYAKTVVEVLESLDVDQVVLVGWSMGGHVALEMMNVFPGVIGVFLVGAPPVESGLRGLLQGFRLPAVAMLSTGRVLNDAQAKRLVELSIGRGAPQHFHRAARRTDGRARRELVNHILQGRNGSGREIVETHQTPIAVVNGRADPFLNLRSLKRPRWANLWRDRCFEIPGGHAPFVQESAEFDGLLAQFALDMNRRACDLLLNPPLSLGG